jgi:DNA-binding transcriptional regulator LsrR (DeoR family)
MTYNTSREEIQQMAIAARLYYEDGRTQEEIAISMGISRPTVSRLLMRAREEHIVTINVINPLDQNHELARHLCQATGLIEAIISPAVPNSTSLNLKYIGLSAARYIENKIKPQDVVGVGWGRTLYAMVQSLQSQSINGVKLIPLTGGLGQISPHFQVNDLIREISKNFNGDPHQLFLPAIVKDGETKTNILLSEDSKSITAIWDNLTVAIVGIGNVDFETEMSVLFVNYLDEGTRSRLKKAKAEGDICMRFFDISGTPVKNGVQGVISISLEQLRRIPSVIAIACGLSKVRAILGAIRGKYIHTLITDDQTAKAILVFLEKEGEQ